MLQRRPTYMAPLPARTSWPSALRRVLPAGLAHRLVRAKNIAFTTAFYQLAPAPAGARKLLLRHGGASISATRPTWTSTSPRRTTRGTSGCAWSPAATSSRRSSPAGPPSSPTTSTVSSPEGHPAALRQVLEADIIVSATGLTLLAFGGIEPPSTGSRSSVGEQYAYRGHDAERRPELRRLHRLHQRLLDAARRPGPPLRLPAAHALDRQRLRDGVPTARRGAAPRPLLDLASGYVQRAIERFPRQGDRDPWRVRQNYVLDLLAIPAPTSAGT